MAFSVLIAGGGPAGLEAALALDRLAGDRVTTTLLAPEAEFTFRPLSVLTPFSEGGAVAYPLARFAADARFTHVRDRLASVDTGAREVRTVTGARLPYDALLIAAGARPVVPFPGAVVFTGSLTDQDKLHAIVRDVQDGRLHSLAFAVPSASTWPLPLYELALLLAGRAHETGLDPELHVVTPEAEPLELFQTPLRHLFELSGIRLHTGTTWSPGLLDVQRVVTLPVLEGPAIPGLPSDEHGFLVADAHGRVVPGVFAAGDATDFHIKQGGLACQMADAAAEQIAADAGAPVHPKPFAPKLQALLLTDHWARYLRPGGGGPTLATRDLRWPPSKIGGRELAPYLKRLEPAATGANR
jgi:sulfide:quinone oxidoreductase